MKQHKISVVLCLFGRYEVLTNQLQEKLEQLEKIKDEYEIVIVADGPQWMAAPMMQIVPLQMPSVLIIETKTSSSLPAVLFNLGIKRASGKYTVFSTLYGANIETTTNLFSSFLEKQDKEGTENIGTPVFYLRPEKPRESDYFLPGALYGQAQTHDLLHIDEWCIPKEILQRIDGFPENTILQEEFERFAALSFLRLGTPVEAGVLPNKEISKSLSLIPYEKRLVRNRDLAKRFAIYSNAISIPQRSNLQCAIDFCQDIDEKEIMQFVDQETMDISGRISNKKRYKIFVVGGYWEYHHNQIAFFNYLENSYGSGFATFNTGLDLLVHPMEIVGYDLVIFTRCRSDESVRLMRFCKARNIPTIYMIDDNWFSIAKDYPDIGGIFKPGNPNFDNFISALSLCKTTWVLSRVLRTDVLPYSSNVSFFQIGVCFSTFISEKKRSRKDDEIYVGFAGSLRWSDEAFRALARLARRRKSIKVFLLGSLSEEQEQLFTGIKTIRVKQQSYGEYAQMITQIQPDIIIAPLKNDHTSNSKCANKYIEAGVVGAVGVFSKVEPYISVVKDTVNGFFVEQDDEEGWYDCLYRITSNITMLRNAQKTAYNDVKEHYSVRNLLPAFQNKITTIIEQEMLEDD